MIKQIVLAAALAASVPSMAIAQATAPAAAPSAAALAKAQELMTTMHIEDLTRRALEGQMKAMTGGLANQLLQSGQFPPALAQDPEFRAIFQRYLDTVSAKVQTSMTASMPQVVEIMTRVYATNFPPAEMDDMLAFYRTKTGQTVLAKLPDVTAQAVAATRDLTMGPAMKAAQEAVPQFMTELKAWAAKHPELAGAKKQ